MMEFVDLAALGIHDVKNRLAILATRADAKGDAETVRDALEAAATLTRLLTLYKVEKGRLRVEIDAHVPADLLEELAAEFGRQSATRIEFDAGAAPTLGYYDESLVRMVLQNALYNALRHATAGIVLAARLDGDFLEFSVRDDGPGYPAAMLDQPPEIRATTREGTGLGLYLAAHVATLHSGGGRRGRIELVNDRGAVFRLRLPK